MILSKYRPTDQKELRIYKSMKIILVFVTFLLQGVVSMETDFTGVSGKDITIICSLDYKTDHVKYFCKGPCTSNQDVLIRSNSGNWNLRKYRIVDYKNYFKVTIFHLTEKDAGYYYCGWDIKYLDDIYRKVSLTINQMNTPVPPKNIDELNTLVPPKTTDEQLNPILYGPAVIFSVALVFVFFSTLILLVAKKRQRVIQQQTGEVSDYENVMPAVTSEGHSESSSPESIALSDTPKDISDYHHLEFSKREENVYHSLHG
ncbi:uncharacterized protein LOC130919923 isoform X2 [Corythoichthys intestinalis]|uniref:uncharacterized protein LOC130919923 isoform X2 n=1 Tax=Corythoichthys intestinalis TaxID=161448 RepID=UPI0025A5256D|nr:uncharacterized protein LOC130919923 isoform X2 [Corythoichthys intestinalis]